MYHSGKCAAAHFGNHIPAAGLQALKHSKPTKARVREHYLRLETLHQDGHQQVEENVIPKRHEGNEVEGCPGGGGCHAVVEDLVPVFLGQNLQRKCLRRVRQRAARWHLLWVSSLQASIPGLDVTPSCN